MLGYLGGLASIFQFTPLREGRRTVHHLTCAGSPDFNSRPSARGDPSDLPKFTLRTISIHAPPRGATLPYPLHCPRPCISIHAPPRGATGLITENNGQAIISIHAPPRGATLLCPVISRAEYISIHAPPRGATGAMMKSMGIADISIHAPPRGATQARTAASTIAYFNSRPSARGDDEAGGHVGRLQISIHAPPRGATSMQYNMSIRKIISIHAPPRGATCYSLGLSLPSVFQFTPLREGRAAEEGDHLRRAFQFTPLREGRPFELCSDLLDDISIHAPPRGATTTTARACSSPTYFNSRPSARGDG